jgi:hypothetical protein
MELLPLEVEKNGYVYKQVKRDDEHKIAIYEQYSLIDKKLLLVGHEIFHIKSQNDTTLTIGGSIVHLVAKELFPSNEIFGQTAWAYITREAAELKYKELIGEKVDIKEEMSKINYKISQERKPKPVKEKVKDDPNVVKIKKPRKLITYEGKLYTTSEMIPKLVKKGMNKAEVAKFLGITENALYYRWKKVKKV